MDLTWTTSDKDSKITVSEFVVSRWGAIRPNKQGYPESFRQDSKMTSPKIFLCAHGVGYGNVDDMGRSTLDTFGHPG